MSWILVWRYLKVALLVIGAIIVALIPFLYFVKKWKKTSDVEGLATPTPSIVKEVSEQVKVAVADVRVERAIITMKSEIKKGQLETIKAEPDGQKRRKELAKFLEQNI